MPAPHEPVAGEAPAFADARACRDWLNAIPLANVSEAQASLRSGLQRLAGQELDALERLKCLELLRDKVAFLQGELRSRLQAKTLPLAAADAAAWSGGLALLEAMEAGYARCLEAARPGGPLAPHAALVAQRLLRYLGAQMALHHVVYRRIDAAVWRRLHDAHARAEREGLATEPVKDSLEGGAEGLSSVREAWLHVLLREAVDLSAWSGPQAEFLEALLRLWVRKARLAGAGEAPAAVQALAVDPGAAEGARALSRDALQPGHRVIETEALGKSLRRRIQGLQAGEDVSRLGLPTEVAGLAPLPLLQRLHAAWCEPPAPRASASASAKDPGLAAAGLVFGLAEAHFFVGGGKRFEAPDASRELTSQEKQDIEVFGRVTQRTHSRMQTEHHFTVEPWDVVEELRGQLRLRRTARATHGLAVGRFVAARLGDAGPFYAGMIAGLVQEADAGIVATVTLFPGQPAPIAARGAGVGNRPAGTWGPALALPAIERLHVPASVVVAAGLGMRGRVLELRDGDGEGTQATVREVLVRGSDFDRVVVS